MLQLKHVQKFCNTGLVLDIPSLELEKGIYWIKGANGSGKTTLLKMIAGLIPFSGDILFHNISIKSQPVAYRRMLGWAETEPVYPAFMNGMELLTFYRKLRNVSTKEVDGLVQLFNLTGFIHNPMGTYSAGMIKKLSLILAFIGGPPLVILDEPLITLDQDAFSSVCTYIIEKHKTAGTCFLMSSHQKLDMGITISGKELIVSNQHIAFME